MIKKTALSFKYINKYYNTDPHINNVCIQFLKVYTNIIQINMYNKYKNPAGVKNWQEPGIERGILIIQLKKYPNI